MEKHTPTYALADIKALIAHPERRLITLSALKGALALGLSDDDIVDCVRFTLGPQHFHKSRQSTKLPGTWQDVYKTAMSGHFHYVKLRIRTLADGQQAIVISFKENEDI